MSQGKLKKIEKKKAYLNQCRSLQDLLNSAGQQDCDNQEESQAVGENYDDTERDENHQYLNVDSSSIGQSRTGAAHGQDGPNSSGASSASWANQRLNLQKHLDPKALLNTDSNSLMEGLPLAGQSLQNNDGDYEDEQPLGGGLVGQALDGQEYGRTRTPAYKRDTSMGSSEGGPSASGGGGADMVKLESDLPSQSGAAPFSRNQSFVKVTDSATLLPGLAQSQPLDRPQRQVQQQDNDNVRQSSIQEVEHSKVLAKQADFNRQTSAEQVRRLKEQFAKMYLFLRQRIKSSSRMSLDTNVMQEVLMSEDRLIFSMDTYLVIGYIKAAIGVVLDIKFEEIEQKLAQQNHPNRNTSQIQSLQDDRNYDLEPSQVSVDLPFDQKNVAVSAAFDSRPGHQQKALSMVDPPSSHKCDPTQAIADVFSPRDGPSLEEVKQVKTQRSHRKSSISTTTDQVPSCPEMYEKLIQDLEADVRKHIRIQQQLKLHIESVEDRVEELEVENEELLETLRRETSKYKAKLSDAETGVKKLQDQTHQYETSLQDTQAELSKLKAELAESSEELKRLKLTLQARTMQDNSFTLNRSIDHGIKEQQSDLGESLTKKQREYSQFLKSTNTETTVVGVLNQSSCSTGSRSGKFAQQQKQKQLSKEQQSSIAPQRGSRKAQSIKQTSSAKTSNVITSVLNPPPQPVAEQSLPSQRPASGRNTTANQTQTQNVLAKTAASSAIKDAYQMKILTCSSSASKGVSLQQQQQQQQKVKQGSTKVLSPRSIGKLHQNLHSQQAYGRKSPLVAQNKFAKGAQHPLLRQQDLLKCKESNMTQPLPLDHQASDLPSRIVKSLHATGAHNSTQNSLSRENLQDPKTKPSTKLNGKKARSLKKGSGAVVTSTEAIIQNSWATNPAHGATVRTGLATSKKATGSSIASMHSQGALSLQGGGAYSKQSHLANGQKRVNNSSLVGSKNQISQRKSGIIAEASQGHQQQKAQSLRESHSQKQGGQSMLPHPLRQQQTNGLHYQLGGLLANSQNPQALINMAAATSLGYPSIINNNIQGLSINYSNHIIQHPLTAAAQNEATSSYPTFTSTALAQPQLQGGTQPYVAKVTDNTAAAAADGHHQSSALSSHRRCRSQSPRNNQNGNAEENEDQDGETSESNQVVQMVNNSMICHDPQSLSFVEQTYESQPSLQRGGLHQQTQQQTERQKASAKDSLVQTKHQSKHLGKQGQRGRHPQRPLGLKNNNLMTDPGVVGASTDKKVRSNSSFSNTKNTTLASQQLTNTTGINLQHQLNHRQALHTQSSGKKSSAPTGHHTGTTSSFIDDSRLANTTFKRSKASTGSHKAMAGKRAPGGAASLNSHSVEHSMPASHDSNTVSSLVHKIIQNSSSQQHQAKVQKSQSSKKSSARDHQSSRSRNYKFKVGSGAASTSASAVNNLLSAAGIGQLGSATVGSANGGLKGQAVGLGGGNHVNYQTSFGAMGQSSTSNNFGLGAFGNLANFGGYLGKNATNTVAGNPSAYASVSHQHGGSKQPQSLATASLGLSNSTASELMRGFKSSQSIPIMSSSQQASVHQMSRQSRDSSGQHAQQLTSSQGGGKHKTTTQASILSKQVLPQKMLKPQGQQQVQQTRHQAKSKDSGLVRGAIAAYSTQQPVAKNKK